MKYQFVSDCERLDHERFDWIMRDSTTGQLRVRHVYVLIHSYICTFMKAHTLSFYDIHCKTLHHTATHCKHTATHYDIPRKIRGLISRCNTLQNNASRCNSLQLTANTLQIHCKHTANALQTHCKHTVNSLQTHCKHTANTLQQNKRSFGQRLRPTVRNCNTLQHTLQHAAAHYKSLH